MKPVHGWSVVAAERPCQGRKRHRAEGFTIVEIVVVMAILAVVLGIGVVAMSRARANRELDGSAAELTAALKFARQTARAMEGCTVTFSGTPPSSYRVDRPDGVTLSRGAFPRTVTATVPSGLLTISFQANGSVTTGGTITLTSSTGRQAQIVLNQDAGTASLTQ